MEKQNIRKVQNGSHKNTVVFILSDVRSGSTWFSYVLGSHSQAVHLGEFYRPFTMDGHTACRLCQAQGKPECDYLYGINKVKTENAFDFAFERFNKSTLIDCSKQLDWLKLFAKSQTFNVKTIHLWRDPRAWYASQKRRDDHITTNAAMESWVNTNENIISELNKLSLSYESVFYDDLCMQPTIYFDKIGKYLQMPFEKEALNYWNIEHHGLGGNGAAFNNLSSYPDAKVLTADDDFYLKMHNKKFLDSRWINELSSKERLDIENNATVNSLLASQHKSFQYFNDLMKNH